MSKKTIALIFAFFICLCLFVAWCYGVNFNERGPQLGTAVLGSLAGSSFFTLMTLSFFQLNRSNHD